MGMYDEMLKSGVIKDLVAEIYWDIIAVKVAPLKGPFFDYAAKPLQGMTYADGRVPVSRNDFKPTLAMAMLVTLNPKIMEMPDAVFGSTTAAMSPAENLSKMLGVRSPYLYVRSGFKDHGLGGLIEGDKTYLAMIAEEKGYIDLVMAEDLTNSGSTVKGSKNGDGSIQNLGEWPTIKGYCAEEGIEIGKVFLVSLVDYNNPDLKQWCKNEDISFKPVVTIQEIFEYGARKEKISQEQYESAMEFLINQKAWREARGLPTKPY